MSIVFQVALVGENEGENDVRSCLHAGRVTPVLELPGKWFYIPRIPVHAKSLFVSLLGT